MAEKLDGVMLVVFTYLDQRLTAHASLPPEKILETPLFDGAANAEGGGAEGGEAGVGSSSKGRRSSTGGSQGMEPVARLLKVGLGLFFFSSFLRLFSCCVFQRTAAYCRLCFCVFVI